MYVYIVINMWIYSWPPTEVWKAWAQFSIFPRSVHDPWFEVCVYYIFMSCIYIFMFCYFIISTFNRAGLLLVKIEAEHSLECITLYFALCDPVTLTFWPNINWLARTIPVASLVIVVSAVWFIMKIDRQNHTQTDANELLTIASVSN